MNLWAYAVYITVSLFGVIFEWNKESVYVYPSLYVDSFMKAFLILF